MSIKLKFSIIGIIFLSFNYYLMEHLLRLLFQKTITSLRFFYHTQRPLKMMAWNELNPSFSVRQLFVKNEKQSPLEVFLQVPTTDRQSSLRI